MRAEVGLLSRNILFRGNPETSATNQYGAHIMLHAGGEKPVIGRIENIELTDVGQAFKLGRYPIHFHMSGNVQGSFTIALPDGRIQTTTYTATHETGFIAEVTYSGTAAYPPEPQGGYGHGR